MPPIDQTRQPPLTAMTLRDSSRLDTPTRAEIVPAGIYGTNWYKRGSRKSFIFSVLARSIGNPALSASEAANFLSGRACVMNDADR
jgi:hypothetical protein